MHAVTRDLRGGSLHKETRSVKELMVRPYLPRFLREGDQAELKVVVNNAVGPASSPGTLDASTSSTPTTEQSLLADFGLAPRRPRAAVHRRGRRRDQPRPSRSRRPRRVGQVAFKVVGHAPATSPTASCARCRCCPAACT